MTFVLWEILIPLIVAFLLGLLFGWLFWGWRRTKITYTEWETMRQKANRSSSVEAEAELAELTAERDRLQADLEACESASAAADLGTGVLGVSGAAAVAAADTASDDTATSDDTADAGSSDAAEADTADAAADEAAEADSADGSGDDGSGDDGSGERAVDGERHPYGEGSHAPFADDRKAQPEGYDIKGNADSMLYHRPDSRSYKVTIAEVWFDTPERAEAAGFALANSHPKD